MTVAFNTSKMQLNKGTAAARGVVDTRFRMLLGETDWAKLPTPIQKRFSKALVPGEMKLYEGEVVSTELTLFGRVLAFVLRLIGAPLPLDNGGTGPSVVRLIEDPTIGGQFWSRSYARRGRFPQVVHSAKRFRGPTGLEEYVGAGLGMALQLSVREGALVFRSSGYFFEALGWRLWLPTWVTPGEMEIVHAQQPDGTFSFRLTLTHPWFGRVLHQLAIYRDLM